MAPLSPKVVQRTFTSYDDFAVFDILDTHASQSSLLAQRDELRSTIQLCSRSQLPDLSAEVCESVQFECIFGLYHLLAGSYVALVQESENWVSINRDSVHINIRRAKKITLYPLFLKEKALSESKAKDEAMYLDLLRKGFDCHNFFFSLDYDLTLSQQKIAKLDLELRRERGNVNRGGTGGASDANSGADGGVGGDSLRGTPLWARADPRFFWNADVVSDLIACSADSWVVPFMSAYVELQPDCEVEDERFEMLFISRRSRHRQGTRFTKRGIDDKGETANFVETEQILVFGAGKISSYVQIRGSIPLLWSSPVHCKYDPVVHIDVDSAKSIKYAGKHVAQILTEYADNAGRSSLTCINLIDNKPKHDQGKLGAAFKKAIDGVKNSVLEPARARTVKYMWFDFHHETKQKGKWANLTKLLKQCENDFAAQKYFCKEASGVISSWQIGVIRTNCMDNLDRTNVVQSLFARRSLLWQLNKAEGPDIMNTPYKLFEKKYKAVWANNANAMSFAYAGTGALKVDFTKTGKVTMKGKYNDGVNAIMRYFVNNFYDADKQDAIDLLTGNFRPQASNPSPFQREESFFAQTLLLSWVGCFAALTTFAPLTRDPLLRQLSVLMGYATVLTSLGIVAAFVFMFKKGSKVGKMLARRPRLVVEFP
jgi:hypothetical protein